MTPVRSLLLFAAGLAAPLAAQSTYYVDGALGLDGPGRGTTAAAPWRTIAYAVANATPPATGVATVRIQGGQSYAPASNGETYPVTLAPNVALEGVAAGGSLPVLAVPAGVTGLRMATTANYGNPAVVHRNLVVQGGVVGFELGGDAGTSHVGIVEACEFRGQLTAGVQSSARGGSNDLSVRRCVLQGTSNTGSGVQQSTMMTFLAGPLQRLRVQGCTLQNWSTGVALANGQIAQWTFDIGIEDTTVVACDFGLALATPASFNSSSGYPKSATVAVARTRVTDCAVGISAVDGPATQGPSHAFTATDVAIARCTTGARIACGGLGVIAFTQYATAWERTLITECATGISADNYVNGTLSVSLRGVDLLRNGTGVNNSSYIGNLTFDMQRCRVLDGTRGIVHTIGGLTSLGSLAVSDTMIGRHAQDAIQASYSVLDLARCTVADAGIGLSTITSQGNVSGCLFSGNSQDTQNSAPPGYPYAVNVGTSATDNATALPGGSNFQFASVGLQRPSLKLARSSPCIDRVGVGGGGTDYEGDPRGVVTNASATAPGDIGADEYMPAGSLRTYGLPTYGAVAASPTISSPATSAPLGGSYLVQLNNAAPAGATSPSLAVLVTGLGDVAAPLPTELGVVGLPGCHLWLDPLVLQTMPPVGLSGSLSTSIAIGANPALRGFVLTHQWLVGLPAPDGFVTSNALRVTLGQ